MKIALSVTAVLLLVITVYWFRQENQRIKINTENETTTNIEQRMRSKPVDSTESDIPIYTIQ